MFRPVLACAATALAALAIAAAAGIPSAGASTFTFFRTPSNLIGCVYQTGPTFLRCDVMYPTRFDGQRSCGEVGDAGRSFTMRRRGSVKLPCASDTSFDPKSRLVPYGTTRRFGPFRCTVSMSGLRCTNAGGHGWFLSRGSQRLF
ncbi:hypothetical protein [Capillimicrobium parvum]|uniref:Secreted protein n=1 Tax=Capillimicrobium parvum TaxID=2884022 RepID=A0A9E7C0U3_9ACTN|nr:hypothetical protein [Capillimicrobium parvum]UGS35892.1 hypothetical protein DSM104329_02289 [Capillimicrobium parvum]